MDQLQEAIERHYIRVQRSLERVVNRSIAEDLCQEVFARLASSLARGEQIEHSWGYIKGIMQNVTFEFFRRTQRQPQEMPEQEVVDSQLPAQPTALADAEHREILRELLGLLTPEEQAIITGRYFSGMTGEALAAALGKPRRTLVDQHDRAMLKLRKLALERGISL